MSDYHILSSDAQGNAFQVVFHIPVPDQTNEVSYSYRTAIVEFQGGAASIASQVPFITGGEETQLQAGELYEVAYTFHSNPGEDLAAKRDRLDQEYAAKVTEVQQDFQDKLGYWGYNRDVP